MQTIGRLGMRYFSRESSKPKTFVDEIDSLNGTDHVDRSPNEVQLSGVGWYFVPIGVRDERDRKGYFARLANGRTSARGVHSGHWMGEQSGGHNAEPWSGSSAEHTTESGEEELPSIAVLVHVLQALIKAKEGHSTLRCFLLIRRYLRIKFRV
jgi:hypothetical protein